MRRLAWTDAETPAVWPGARGERRSPVKATTTGRVPRPSGAPPPHRAQVGSGVARQRRRSGSVGTRQTAEPPAAASPHDWLAERRFALGRGPAPAAGRRGAGRWGPLTSADIGGALAAPGPVAPVVSSVFFVRGGQDRFGPARAARPRGPGGCWHWGWRRVAADARNFGVKCRFLAYVYQKNTIFIRKSTQKGRNVSPIVLLCKMQCAKREGAAREAHALETARRSSSRLVSRGGRAAWAMPGDVSRRQTARGPVHITYRISGEDVRKEGTAMKTITGSALVLCAVVCLSAAATAQTPVGALAIDEREGDPYGWAVDYETTSAARTRALSECGSGCSVVLTFERCAAYAAAQAAGSAVYGWVESYDSAAGARQRALAECGSRGSGCAVRVWGCNGPVVEDGLHLDRAARREIREGLEAGGFDPGGADGMFGPRTRSAIRSWQTSRGARATGYLDAASVASLRPSVAGQPTFRRREPAGTAAASAAPAAAPPPLRQRSRSSRRRLPRSRRTCSGSRSRTARTRRSSRRTWRSSRTGCSGRWRRCAWHRCGRRRTIHSRWAAVLLAA